MAEPARLTDEERRALIQAAERKVEELVDARIASFLRTIESAARRLEAEQKREPKRRHYPLFWALMPLPLMATILIYGWLRQEWPSFLDTVRLEQIHYQVAVLAFVVALAAYLANVSRDIIKVLSAVPVSKETLVARTKMRKNLAWVTVVEIHLVIHGVLTSARLLAGQHWKAWTGVAASHLENFLLIYLAMIIVSLAILHIRQWCLTIPFKAIETLE